MKRCIPLFLAVLSCLFATAQPQAVPLAKHPFVKYSANVLHYDTTSATMQHFFAKWQQLEQTGTGALNIVHIGSSHVQAGTLPNTIRYNLLASYPQLVGGRGLIFPYSAAARCNNPSDYKVRCVQKMQLTRNVHKELACDLGVTGIAVTAQNERAEIRIALNDARINYQTRNIVVIGHSDNGVMPRLRIEGSELYPSYVDARTDRYIFNITHTTDSFTVVLPCSAGQSFNLMGIMLGNHNQGIIYHSIGVNGASTTDYLKCKYFTRDLRLLYPDAVVFGIGINDAVPTNFDTAAFRRNYLQLVDSVRSVNPDCAIIFITNNDSYRKTGRRRYNVNTNGQLVREVFYRLAHETGGAVWDQFEVMGGLRSMEKWQRAKLAQADRIHFTHEGYRLVGNLFSNALFEAYTSYLKSHQTPSNDNDRYRYISY